MEIISKADLESFLTSEKGRSITEGRTMVTQATRDRALRRQLLLLESPAQVPGDNLARIGFYESREGEQGCITSERLCFTYPNFDYLGPDYKVSFNPDSRGLIKLYIESSPRFFQLPDNKSGVAKEYVSFQISLGYTPENSHMSQATYLLHDEKEGDRKSGFLVDLVYLNPYYQNSEVQPLEQSAKTYQVSHELGGIFDFRTNIPDYRVQKARELGTDGSPTNCGLYRFSTTDAATPTKTIVLVQWLIDINEWNRKFMDIDSEDWVDSQHDLPLSLVVAHQ